MAAIVLVTRFVLGGVFLLLGLELAYGVLPADVVPAPFQQLIAALSAPETGEALRGAPEFVAGLMIFSGLWVPLGLLLLVPVLLHLGLSQWYAAPDDLALVGALVALELFLLWAHAPALKGVLSPMTRSRWGKVQTSKS